VELKIQATVSHEFYLVNARDRYEALKRLADANPDIFSVVFVEPKEIHKLLPKLVEDGYSAAALQIYLKRNVMV
jgi:ATP-dependent RNA helicase DeaD